MQNSTTYFICAIFVVAIITWSTRALPFLIFRNRQLPPTVRYLGNVLPPAIMAILVFYCLRNITVDQYPYGAAEIISSFAVVMLQILKKNMYLSIIVGTVLYMVLIRIFFPI